MTAMAGETVVVDADSGHDGNAGNVNHWVMVAMLVMVLYYSGV